MAGKIDELDQGQTRLRVLPGRQGTTQGKMNSAELLLHADPDGAWIIPSQAADVRTSGQWRLQLHSVRCGLSRTRAVTVQQVQCILEAIERKGTNR